MRKIMTVGGMLAAVLVAAGWLFVAPTRLGGHATYLVTHGVSMEPRFHTGDLAVLYARSSYEVGEVVAYHSQTLHTVVMHRIVGRAGDGFVFKGDNNTWLDPDHPTQSELIGSLAVRIPQGGHYLSALHSTRGRTAASVLLALALVGGGGRLRRRRALRTTGGGHRAGRHRATPPAVRHNATRPRTGIAAAHGQVVGAACLLIAAIAADAWVWHLPTTQATKHAVSVTQHGTFGYTATVPKSLIYPTGEVVSGGPIFTTIVRTLDVSFDYAASAPTQGSVALDAALVGPSGWRSPIAAGLSQPIVGGKGTASVRVDLATVQKVVNEFGAATGLQGQSASLVIEPVVQVHGLVSGTAMAGDFTGSLGLALGQSQLTVVADQTTTGAVPSGQTAPAPSSTDSPLSVASALSATVPGVGPRVLSVLGRHIAVRAARDALMAAVGLAVIGLLIAIVGSSGPSRAEGNPAAARRRYAGRIVDADPTPLEGSVVDLTSLAALHSIAQRYDRVILHMTDSRNDDSGRHSYVVRDELSWYRYEIRPEGGRHAGTRATKPRRASRTSRPSRTSRGAEPVAGWGEVFSLPPRIRPVDIIPGALGARAWAESYVAAG